MLTEKQKKKALALLGTDAPRPVKVNDKYVQVLPFSPDGIHTLQLHEYVMSNRRAVGYITLLSVLDEDGETEHRYREVQGPLGLPSGWMSSQKGL